MIIRTLTLLLLISCAQSIGAQQAVDAVGDGLSVAERAAGPSDFRNTAAYPFPALSRTVRDMQHLAHAFQLRDYCADDRVSDEFVRVQLARFSLLTGREETCRSLKDY